MRLSDTQCARRELARTVPERIPNVRAMYRASRHRTRQFLPPSGYFRTPPGPKKWRRPLAPAYLWARAKNYFQNNSPLRGRADPCTFDTAGKWAPSAAPAGSNPPPLLSDHLFRRSRSKETHKMALDAFDFSIERVIRELRGLRSRAARGRFVQSNGDTYIAALISSLDGESDILATLWIEPVDNRWAATINITPSATQTLAIGANLQLAQVALDSDGNILNPKIGFVYDSSDHAKVTVSTTGLVHAVAATAGVTITVQDAALHAMGTLTVIVSA